ncbi:MAG: polymer-forming cytoskeletal protein [Gammaproteobacteria bacterium]|nr:polymer-forming cytoskeletal protein [Gammaproteobacteria bacterium]MBU1447351.1 polymer-forming cytoskeletal protein [Gammaproteobacteria bacterium]MDD2928534.1 polymer-forming cytoskeletal protein [Sideroxydans sp.]MDD5470474.1 polymer-forming cytoskeletal protein [Sideroxydans sp.]
MFSKHSKPQNRIDSLIGVGTRVNGDLHFSGGLRIDGEVTGSVIADPAKASTLVLSEQARVHGEISVTHLVVNGMVTGPVQASEYLELQSKAKVTGDVRYKTLEIQLGAIVEGKLVHINEASEKVVSLKVSGSESK